MARKYITGIGWTGTPDTTTPATAGYIQGKDAIQDTNNIWAGKTPAEVRALEYQKSPGMQPMQAAVAAPGTTYDNNTIAYLKDYVAQMKAAGYSNMAIKQKLIKTGSINIPNELPQNFGANTWAGGMNEEFGTTNRVPQTIEMNMPSANEYLNYQPGGGANRLPSYSEFSGQPQPQLYKQGGQFSQTKNANLMTALNNYIQNYRGAKVPFSQGSAEAGMVGLPQELANQWMPEKAAIEQNKANGLSIQSEVQRIREQNMGAGIMPTDDVETAMQKAEAYDSYTKEVDANKENKDQNSVIQLDADLQEAFLAGNTPTAEDVMAYGMQYGLKLTLEQAYAIVTLAQKKVSSQTTTTVGE